MPQGKKKATKKQPKTYFISAVCSAQGCRNATASARKMSDFFVTTCADHEGKTIKLDMKNIVPFATGKQDW